MKSAWPRCGGLDRRRLLLPAPNFRGAFTNHAGCLTLTLRIDTVLEMYGVIQMDREFSTVVAVGSDNWWEADVSTLDGVVATQEQCSSSQNSGCASTKTIDGGTLLDMARESVARR